jgi:hypothetical protein
MSKYTQVGPIEPGESKLLRLEFASEIEASVTITSVTMVCTLTVGVDPAPSNFLLGAPVILGLNVLQRIQHNVDDCEYLVRALAQDSSGLRHAVGARVRTSRLL